MEPGTSQQYPVTGKGAQTGSVWVVEQGNAHPDRLGSLSLQTLKPISDL